MGGATFEPRGYLRFDLGAGRLQTRDDHRHFVVPEELLTAAGSSGSLAVVAHEWGLEQGTALAALSGAEPLKEAPERFLGNLANLLASLGWGRPELESWGGVLFAVVSNAPSGVGADILAAFLAGAFEAVGGDHFECIHMAEDRFLLTGEDGAKVVREWVSQGAGTGEVVTRMLAGEHLGLAAGGS